jgi:hypothetical protein
MAVMALIAMLALLAQDLEVPPVPVLFLTILGLMLY